MLTTIADYIVQFATWLAELLLYIPKKIWESLLDALASLVEAIPVPDAFSSANEAFSGLAPAVVYWAGVFCVPQGITMVMSAYVIRFLIRRIPLIG